MLSFKKFLDPLRNRGDIVSLLVFTALVMMGNGLVSPILSIYGSVFSQSGTLIGLVITIFGVGRLLINLPSGVLAQRFGRRPVLLCGPAVLVVGSIGAAVATDISSLLFWRLVQGVGSGIYMTVSTLMLVDIASDDNRGRLMALHQASLLLGTGLGPLVGGLIADRWGYTAPFWGYAAVCAIGFVVAWCGVHETLSSGRYTEKSETPARTFSILRDAEFLTICLTNFGIFFTRAASLWMVVPLLATQSYRLSLGMIGVILAGVTIANFIVLPQVGGAIDRFGAAITSFVALLVTATALAIVALGNSRGCFFGGLGMLGVASGFNVPAVYAQAGECTPRQSYGQAIGLLRTSGDLGFVAGPFIVGGLADVVSLSNTNALLLNGVLLVMTALLVIAFARKNAGRGLAENPRPASSSPSAGMGV